MKRIELNPCPLCKADAEHRGGIEDYVQCTKCGIRTQGFGRAAEATKAWNKLKPAKAAPAKKPVKKPAKRKEKEHGGGRR